MLDNLIVNIRTILPISKANNSRDDDKFNGNYANESAIAFLEHSSNRDSHFTNGNDQDHNNSTNRTMLNVVRSYFSQLYQKKPASNRDNDIMLPRAFDYADLQVDWDPVELKAREKFIEDIDNVIDKFVRVTSVNDSNSPKRTELFYVYIITHSTHSHQAHLFYSFSIDKWKNTFNNLQFKYYWRFNWNFAFNRVHRFGVFNILILFWIEKCFRFILIEKNSVRHTETKWSWGDSSSIGHGRWRWLPNKNFNGKTRTQTQPTDTIARR